MKYKELPPFENNEFKVGDVIVVYDSHYTEDAARVTKIKDDIIWCSGSIGFHFKQCRKLEEILEE
jgi:hypothetical protein